MTEPDNDDAALALVSQLEAEARFVDAGKFTLDSHKAREKLAAYQLAEPERYVLFLVEAAHLLQSCTNVAFTIEDQLTRVVFEGVELKRAELQGCFDALFVDVTELDPESARRLHGRQRLALAINAALGLPRARIEMCSMLAGEESMRVVIDEQAHVQTHALPSSSSTAALVVEIHHEAGWPKQQAVLRENAGYATVPMQLNGNRIGGGLADLCATIEIRDADGRVVGQAGWCAARARQGLAMVAFVANGVIVETQSEPELPVGVLAVLDANDLARDISQSKLQRDETFQRRVEAVAPACEALSQPAPTLGPPIPWLREIIWGVVTCLFGLLALATAVIVWVVPRMWGMGTITFIFGLLLGSFGIGMIQHARRLDRIRAYGYAGVGGIRYVSTATTTAMGLYELSGNMSIERPGQEDYVVSFVTSVDPSTATVLEPGKRVYVRIDPNDPKMVVFDPGE
jgi:hypothetical protein